MYDPQLRAGARASDAKRGCPQRAAHVDGAKTLAMGGKQSDGGADWQAQHLETAGVQLDTSCSLQKALTYLLKRLAANDQEPHTGSIENRA